MKGRVGDKEREREKKKGREQRKEGKIEEYVNPLNRIRYCLTHIYHRPQPEFTGV